MPTAFAYATDVCGRDENQDCHGAFNLNGFDVIVLCDGMGGHVGGAHASALAVRTIHEHLQDASPSDLPSKLEEAILAANRAIYEEARRNYKLMGMGTTVVAAAIAGDKAYVAHVGDSRAYLLSPSTGAVDQLTRDHTMVNLFVDAELLSPEDAATHPEAHVLSRSLGVERQVDVDVSESIALTPQQRLVLTSDGVHGLFEPAAFLDVGWANLTAAVNEFVSAVRDGGGDDNATMVAFATEAEGGMAASSIPDVAELQERAATAVADTTMPAPRPEDSRPAPTPSPSTIDDVVVMEEDTAPGGVASPLATAADPIVPSTNGPASPDVPNVPAASATDLRGRSRPRHLLNFAILSLIGLSFGGFIFLNDAEDRAARQRRAAPSERPTVMATSNPETPEVATPAPEREPQDQVPTEPDVPSEDVAFEPTEATVATTETETEDAAGDASSGTESADDEVATVPDGEASADEIAEAPETTEESADEEEAVQLAPGAGEAPTMARTITAAAQSLTDRELAVGPAPLPTLVPRTRLLDRPGAGRMVPLTYFGVADEEEVVVATFFAPDIPPPPRRAVHRPKVYDRPAPRGPEQWAAVQAARERQCRRSLDMVTAATTSSIDYASLYQQVWYCFNDTHQKPLEEAQTTSFDGFIDLIPHFEGRYAKAPTPSEGEEGTNAPVLMIDRSFMEPAPDGLEHRLEAYVRGAGAGGLQEIMTDLMGEAAVADDLGTDLLLEAQAAAAMARTIDSTALHEKIWARRLFMVVRMMNDEPGRLVRTHRPNLAASIGTLVFEASGGDAAARFEAQGLPNSAVPRVVADALAAAAGKVSVGPAPDASDPQAEATAASSGARRGRRTGGIRYGMPRRDGEPGEIKIYKGKGGMTSFEQTEEPSDKTP